jgi:hypothetical protein
MLKNNRKFSAQFISRPCLTLRQNEAGAKSYTPEYGFQIARAVLNIG